MLSAKLDASPQTSQEALLLHLKKQGEMTVAQLSTLLKITEMAVRRHLAHLQSKGLVESRLVKQERGRPNYLYRLGPQAPSLFLPVLTVWQKIFCSWCMKKLARKALPLY